MARRLRRSALAVLMCLAWGRPASATPDDTSGLSEVIAVEAERRQVVVATAGERAGDWTEISVFSVPSRSKVRSLPLPAGGRTPPSWARWVDDQRPDRRSFEAPRASRVSPDGTHVVTVRERFHATPSPHYTVAVDLVSATGRRTVLRRRSARGCESGGMHQRPLDLRATWVGSRTVVLAGSILARCGVITEVEPFLELVAVEPGRRPLPTPRLVGLLRREAERLDVHGHAYVADRPDLLSEALELAPADAELRIDRAAALFERGRLDRDGVLGQLLDVIAIGDEGAYRALDHARGLRAFDPVVAEPAIDRVLEPVVHAEGIHERHSWRAECRHELGCAIRRDGEIVVYVPRRGSWACDERAGTLACIHTHATRLDVQEGWALDLGRGRARRLGLPVGRGPVVGAPRLEGAMIRLELEGSPTASTIPIDG